MIDMLQIDNLSKEFERLESTSNRLLFQHASFIQTFAYPWKSRILAVGSEGPVFVDLIVDELEAVVAQVYNRDLHCVSACATSDSEFGMCFKDGSYHFPVFFTIFGVNNHRSSPVILGLNAWISSF